MPKVLFIVGPTTSGKTSFALDTARRLVTEGWTIDLISADSRQVYKGLEVLSGVDIPADFSLHESAFANNDHTIFMHGLSLINADEEWSVSHFKDFAEGVITQAWQQPQRLPIIVGGTGLYAQQLFSSDPRLHTQPDQELREQAATMELLELQQLLQSTSNDVWLQMSESDQQNPRRLVRAIELSKVVSEAKMITPPVYSSLSLGLQVDKEALKERITERVQSRWSNGAVQEVEQLISRYDDWSTPAFSSTGIKEIKAYITEQLEPEQAQMLWTNREFQYAKRQLTWWKKYAPDQWINTSQEGWHDQAYSQITQWLAS